MKFLLSVTLGAICSLSALKAELPTLKENLGTYALFEDRRARFKIKTDGKIIVIPFKDSSKSELYRGFDILPKLQVRQNGSWVNKKIKKESFKPVGGPAVDPKEPIGFKVKVTGDMEYQFTIQKVGKDYIVKAWVTDLGQDGGAGAKPEDLEVRLALGIKFHNLFFRLTPSSEEAEIKKKTKGSEVRFVNLQGKQKKFDFAEPIELAESGLDKGVLEFEVRSKKSLGVMKGLRVKALGAKPVKMEFQNYGGTPAFSGFTLVTHGPVNQMDEKGAGGLILTYK